MLRRRARRPRAGAGRRLPAREPAEVARRGARKKLHMSRSTRQRHEQVAEPQRRVHDALTICAIACHLTIPVCVFTRIIRSSKMKDGCRTY
jgi:hypothetical protein